MAETPQTYVHVYIRGVRVPRFTPGEYVVYVRVALGDDSDDIATQRICNPRQKTRYARPAESYKSNFIYSSML